jgi:hypothetical protein
LTTGPRASASDAAKISIADIAALSASWWSIFMAIAVRLTLPEANPVHYGGRAEGPGFDVADPNGKHKFNDSVTSAGGCHA